MIGKASLFISSMVQALVIWGADHEFMAKCAAGRHLICHQIRELNSAAQTR